MDPALAGVVPAAVGAIVSGAVAGVFSYRQGRARGQAESLERFEDRLRAVELRSASMRAALRVERRKAERKGRREQSD